VLQHFGFWYSSPQSTPLPTGHSLSAPPSHESVEPSGPYPDLVGCLMYLMTCTRPDLAYPLSILYVGHGARAWRTGSSCPPGHEDASWVEDLATQRSSQGYTFSLGSGSFSWRSTRSSFVLSSCSETCPYVIHTGVRAGQTCGEFHTENRCFSRLDNAWCAGFGDDVERPRWTDLLRSGVAIFNLEYDAIISAMYALSFSAKGDCYRCVPPDPGIAAAALGASASGTPPGTAPVEALHTFTLDSGASRCFFRNSTTLTPLPAPVLVRLADPSDNPVVAHSSTILPCPAAPSGSLSGLHLPSFSTNL
ncbi:unnamed protein product, partial [Closterium sp. NIES-53]